jgi:hypothetical protein
MKDIFYIRHIANWGNIQGKSVIKHLKDNGIVAIHFDALDTWDSSKYEETFGPTAIDYLNRFNEDSNLIIVASYQDEDEILIGKPKINSKFFFRERFNQDDLPYLKCIEMEIIRKVKISEFPQAFILAPQQGTLVQWHQGKIAVNAYLNLIEYDTLNPNFYLPYQLEILAEEYLRKKNLLKAKLFKTGGYLKDLDTLGIDNENNQVLVQVKFKASELEFTKFQNIADQFPKSKSYFFSTNIPKSKTSYTFKHVSIEDVLEFFKEEKFYLEKLIKP